MNTAHTASRRSLRALDWANLFLADVRDGIGPFLAVYLLASHQWDAASIGIAMSAMGIASLIAQGPAGALIDRVHDRRIVMALATLVIGASCVLMTQFVNLWAIVLFQALMGIAAALLAPALAATTLGLVGYRKLAQRQGRNEMFNHAGNVAAALMAGLLGHYVGREWLFYAVSLFALASLVSILLIRGQEVDPALARGAKASDDEETARVSGLMAVLTHPPILYFALAGGLFHFANAAMLPLAGQAMTAGTERGASLYMSACIIAAQLVMIPMAKFAGHYAEAWGRKPLLLLAFGVLPLRGLLYTLSDAGGWIVAVQLLDGVGAGLMGVLTVLVVADLTRGSGRFNVTLGAVATVHGIGAACSNLAAGFVVVVAGYNAGFLFLAGAATVALLFAWLAVGESRGHSIESAAPPAKTRSPAFLTGP